MNYHLNIEIVHPKRKGNKETHKNNFTSLLKRAIKILQEEKKRQLELKGGNISLIFMDDQQIQKINKMYRKKNKPTDVISLSYFEEQDFPQENMVGEIFISLDTAQKQAKEHAMTLEEELQFLFLHGLLHIFGYDHEQEEERKEMFDLQDEILQTKVWRAIIEELTP